MTYDRQPYSRAGTAQGIQLALEATLPLGVECVALVRGPRPRTLWARLWAWIGLRLARRAGWTIIRAAHPLSVPPEHVNCRCIVREVD